MVSTPTPPQKLMNLTKTKTLTLKLSIRSGMQTTAQVHKQVNKELGLRRGLQESKADPGSPQTEGDEDTQLALADSLRPPEVPGTLKIRDTGRAVDSPAW